MVKSATRREAEEEDDIVIVGGGIVGLATALGLHKKGIRSLVLERSENLRAYGATIAIYTNGWRCLDQLGVAQKLRQRATLIKGTREINNSWTRYQPNGKEELRSVRRSDLMKALSEGLPPESIRFSSRVVAVEVDPITNYPLLHLDDNTLIHAKVLIGCDGAHSLIAESLLGFKPAKFTGFVGIRGLTNFVDSHGLPNEYHRFGGDVSFFGRTPIDDHVVSWYLARRRLPTDSEIAKDPKRLRDSTIQAIKELSLPEELTELVKNCDLDTLSYTGLRYKAPWDLLIRSFRKGTITLAGDAMHAMGPFLQQGGSAGLEDAVVLARCLSQALHTIGEDGNGAQWRSAAEAALDKYVKERWKRVMRLTIQTYMIGSMATTISSKPLKMFIIFLMILFFRHPLSHTRYDCGPL